ncbi:methyl-CpG-binding domain protein 3-like 2 [Ochotona curzoniae]|uniref:methyl-CpG-binding domain protein 3-like 2 n=1 Tax=Ochotona curzoniae TaxID=130825 RepID=UPI001B34EE21|nr:methyl-CpG-binding domain protein 3-like 2 [Ochotona curzoniae]
MAMEGSRPDSFPTQPTLGRLRRSMIPNMLRRKPRVRAVDCVLSRRLTSCIFQRPVTRVTAHPRNKVRRSPEEATLQKPQQRCALQRLQGLQACSSEGQLLSPLDFANASQTPTRRIPGTSAVSAGAGHQKSTPKCTASPATDWCTFVPLVDMGLSQQPSSGQVTAGDIQRQAWKVKKARRRLAQALQADKIMREEECAAG